VEDPRTPTYRRGEVWEARRGKGRGREGRKGYEGLAPQGKIYPVLRMHSTCLNGYDNSRFS